MKFLILFLFPVFSFACPNFQGNFRWETEDNFADIKVTQVACSKVTMVHDAGFGFTITNEHILDGKKRLVEDNGDFQAYEEATISDQEMVIEEERHRTDEEDGTKSVSFVRITVLLSVDNDLVIVRETMRSDRVIVDRDKTTYKRY